MLGRRKGRTLSSAKQSVLSDSQLRWGKETISLSGMLTIILLATLANLLLVVTTASIRYLSMEKATLTEWVALL